MTPMLTTRTRPSRSSSLDDHLEQRARVAGGRSFSEAPIGWGLLVGGTLYGVYLMSTGGMGAVNGAMVATVSLVAGSGAVFVGV